VGERDELPVPDPAARVWRVLPGLGTLGACDGSFSVDLNALWCPSCPKASSNPGESAAVQTQFWYRDPLNTSGQTTSLTSAVQLWLGP